MHILTICLIIFGSLFWIAFIWFSLVFIIHRKLLNANYQIKERYNLINQYLMFNNFAYLKKLGEHNDKIKEVVDKIENSFTIFKNQTQKVKSKIMKLSEINKHYLYIRGYKLTKEIKNDLTHCENTINNFKSISTSATEYSKNISDLITEYRNIYDMIIEFYKINLSLRYTNKIFYDWIYEINLNLIEVNEYLLKPNNDKILEIFQKIDSNINKFYGLIKIVYSLDKVFMYLTALKKKIDDAFNKNVQKSLSHNDTIDIEKKFVDGTISLNDIEKNLKEIKIKDAFAQAILANKYFNEIIYKIESGEATSLLVQRNIKIINDQINILKNEYKEVDVSLKNILKYFNDSEDSFVISSTKKLDANIKAIVLFYTSIESEYKNFNLINREEFLNKINDISKKILNWRIELNNFIDKINERYRTAINTIDDLANLKLTLHQLLSIMSINTDKNKSEIATIQYNIESINDLEAKLMNDYFKYIDEAEVKIKQIKDEVQPLIQLSLTNSVLKQYTQRLMFYCNKFRNEHQDIETNITNAELFYSQLNYQSALDLLIETASRIVNSMKKNKMQG